MGRGTAWVTGEELGNPSQLPGKERDQPKAHGAHCRMLGRALRGRTGLAVGWLGKGMNQGGRNPGGKTEGKGDERGCSGAWGLQCVPSASQTLCSCFPAEGLCLQCLRWEGQHRAKHPGCQDGAVRQTGLCGLCWLAIREPGQLESRIKGSGARRMGCRDSSCKTSS